MVSAGKEAGMARRRAGQSGATTGAGGDGGQADAAVLTAASIAAMNEATLWRRVLIPLFEAMGYRDVREFHHTRELGKDIVAWTLGASGTRENHAVVAKAAPLNGRAGWGPGSVSEVMAQIHQSFGDPFPDLATGALSPVDHCWVITNKAVAPEARVTLSAALRGSPHAGKITIVDGQGLWELVKEHMPSAFFTQVGEAIARGTALDPHYTIDVATNNGEITYIVHEKHPGAFDERPLTFEIDPVPARAEVLAALRQVHEEGVEVQLTGEAARAIHLADEFRHLAPPLDTVSGVTIAPPEPIVSYTARLVVDDGSQQPLSFENLAIDLLKIRPGEGRFTNRRRPSGILLRFDMHLGEAPTGDAPLAGGVLHYEPISRNVADLLVHHQLAARLRRRCTLRLINQATHERIIELRTTAATTTAGEAKTRAFLGNLVQLQDRCGVALNIPADADETDLATLDRLSAIVATGVVRGRWERLELTATITEPAALEEMLSGEPRPLRLVGTGAERFGGASIDLGSAEITYLSARLEDPEAVRAQLATNPTSVRLGFTPGEIDTLERRYTDWLPRRRGSRRKSRG